MALTNLGELKASIADWLNREDLTAQIPDFIDFGTRRINADHRSRVTVTEERNVSTVASENQQNPVVNNNNIEVKTLKIDDKVIPFVTFEEYSRERLDSSYANGVWCYADGAILYSGWPEANDPTPAAGGAAVEVEWFAFGNSEWNFADDNGTTAFFNLHPEIFLYASLVEAAVYLRDAEGVEFYQVRYEELMDKTYKAAKRRQVSGGMSVTSIGGDHYFDRSY